MYFDPGIGSLIIQVLLGALMAVPAILGLWWGKLEKVFRKNRRNEKT